jgi:hypothetical protein
MSLFSILLFGGCFAGFLTDYLSYQALNYQITEPRVLAVRTDPLFLLSGDSVIVDALIVAPTEDDIRSHRVSVCGLGHATQTTIWNLSCFEDVSEVSQLGIGMLPMQVQIPQVPVIDCEDRYGGPPVNDTGGDEDSGLTYTMESDPCSHNLPMLVESNVLVDKDTRQEQERTIYGGDYATWYTESPENNNIPIANRHREFLYTQEAKGGDEIPLEWIIDGKIPQAAFHWYVDAGILVQTGLTSGTYEEPSENFPVGRTFVWNTLRVPEDFEGKLRIWVVAHYNWNSLMDMAWSEGVIEVQP